MTYGSVSCVDVGGCGVDCWSKDLVLQSRYCKSLKYFYNSYVLEFIFRN